MKYKFLFLIVILLSFFFSFSQQVNAADCPTADTNCGGNRGDTYCKGGGSTCADYTCVTQGQVSGTGQPYTIQTCKFTPALQPPGGVVSTNKTASSLTINWTKVEGTQKYTIFYNKEGEAPPQQKDIFGANTTTGTITGLSPATKYAIAVVACNQANCSDRSEPISDDTAGGTTCLKTFSSCTIGVGSCCEGACIPLGIATSQGICLKKPPDSNASLSGLTPKNLRASGATGDTIKLAWDGLADATSYQIYYKVVPGTDPYQQKTSETVAVDLTGLAPNTTYSIFVIGVNSAGESGKSNEIQQKTALSLIDTGSCCSTGFRYNQATNKCTSSSDSDTGTYLCKETDFCNATTQQCEPPLRTPPCKQFVQIDEKGVDVLNSQIEVSANTVLDPKKTYRCTTVSVALLGDIPTEIGQFIKTLFGIILGLSGGIAVFLIILGGYHLIISQGNPEKIQAARETITSAIVGLLFIIFSMVILQIIGFEILHIPGFG